MKDRWKLLIISVVIALVLAIIIGTISGSFRKVPLRNYGILKYNVYKTVENQDARSNGNYLVGLDHSFLLFPRGIITINFTTLTLTKDRSMVELQGFFAGRLIKGEVMTLYENYGYQYMSFLQASIEELAREAIEAYTLSDLISNRISVQNNVNSYVCLKIQTEYAWIQCDLVSLGQIGSNIPEPALLQEQTIIEDTKVILLEQQIASQKQANVYVSGGLELLESLENLNSELFYNITSTISTALSTSNRNSSAAQYIVSSARFPTLSNEIIMKI